MALMLFGIALFLTLSGIIISLIFQTLKFKEKMETNLLKGKFDDYGDLIKNFLSEMMIKLKFLKYFNIFAIVISLISIIYILSNLIIKNEWVILKTYHFIAFGIFVWNLFFTLTLKNKLKDIKKIKEDYENLSNKPSERTKEQEEMHKILQELKEEIKKMKTADDIEKKE